MELDKSAWIAFVCIGLVLAVPLANVASSIIWKQIFAIATAIRTWYRNRSQTTSDGIEYAVVGIVALVTVALTVLWYFGRHAAGITPRGLHDIITFR